jgi:hypothetical protein
MGIAMYFADGVLHNLYPSLSIIMTITSRRKMQARHVACIGVRGFSSGSQKIPLERPRRMRIIILK